MKGKTDTKSIQKKAWTNNSNYLLMHSDLWLHLCIFVYIYQTLLPLVACDTRSIFKQSKAGLDPEFSFSQTGCITKAKELSQSKYLQFIAQVKRTDVCKHFPKGISTKENANSFVQYIFI